MLGTRISLSAQTRGTAMNLRCIDLNLLVVLKALVEERNATRAAETIGVSQSAVSHALRRLRMTFNDELLIRTPEGMRPTAYAESLAQAIGGSLRQIEEAIQSGRQFDPATTERRFSMRVSDYAAVYFLPRLCREMRRLAPAAQLEVQHFDKNDHEQRIAKDEVQIRLAMNNRHEGESHSSRLLDDRFVVIMNARHPAARKSMDLNRYLALHHLKVSVAGVGTNAIDEALAAMGLIRKIAMTVPSWLEMRQVIETTDLVAVVPHHWLAAEEFKSFSAKPLPVARISLSIDLVWHANDANDAGHTWFRGIVQRVFQPAPRLA
jgi:DNA-binding transcriptional LysR family regulator